MKRKSIFSLNDRLNQKTRRNSVNNRSELKNDDRSSTAENQGQFQSCIDNQMCQDGSQDMWSFERRPTQINLASKPLTPRGSNEILHEQPSISQELSYGPKSLKNLFLSDDNPQFEQNKIEKAVEYDPKRKSKGEGKRLSRSRRLKQQSIFSLRSRKGSLNEDSCNKSFETSKLNSRNKQVEQLDNSVNLSSFVSDKRERSRLNVPVPESQRIDASDDEDECNVLETSIVEEKSPQKKEKRKTQSRLQYRLISTLDANVRESQHISDTSQSQPVSLRISEDPSTQSPPSANQTPISIWMQKDKTSDLTTTEEHEIRLFESPSQSQVEKGASRKRRRNGAKKSLFESFKAIKARYDSSVRLFSHDFRSGKYDQESAVDLVIRNVIQRQDRLVTCLAYDVKHQKDRIIIFKPNDHYQIVEGACLKLFLPWQEITIAASGERVIIGADFYKVLRRTDTDFCLSKQQLQEILERPMSSLKVIRASNPLFMDIVPYTLRCIKTIRKQLSTFPTFVDIDICVLNSWKHSSSVLALIKDSDDFLSFLQISLACVDILSKLSPGTKLKLSRIAVKAKITLSENLSPFSILHLYGAKQTYFYIFNYELESNCVLDECANVSLPNVKGDLVDIDDIYDACALQDRRVSLNCKLKELGEDYILVTDVTDRSLKIQFVFNPNYSLQEIPFDVNANVLIRFLRLIHGRTIWDHYTTIERAMDEEEDDF